MLTVAAFVLLGAWVASASGEAWRILPRVGEGDKMPVTHCLECGAKQAGGVTECARCGASGGEPDPSAVTLTGYHGSILRLDSRGITLKYRWLWGNEANADRVIPWDQVHWLRDGPRPPRGARQRWVPEIVLKDGACIRAMPARSATPGPVPETLAVIRRFARQHRIPAVLTGRLVGREPAVDAELLPDPGGEPGLREWTGIEWSPLLYTDAGAADAGAAAGTELLTKTWVPLPKQAQQQHWELAVENVTLRRTELAFLVTLTWFLGLLLVGGLAFLGVAIASFRPAGLVWLLIVVGAVPLLALCTAALVGAVGNGRRRIRHYAEVAALAQEAAAQACANDVQSAPESTWVVSRGNDELRLDDHEIMVREGGQTRWIAWDDVRWFRDSESPQTLRRHWVLEIVRKDGSTVRPKATSNKRQADPPVLATIGHAARHHAIPVVLTGKPVRDKPRPADRPGFYLDPGGEPGLREWSGTEWLPSLLVSPDCDGPAGQVGPVSVVSPLSGDVQRREWAAAIRAVPSPRRVAGATFLILVLWIAVLPYPVIAIPDIYHNGFWLGPNHAGAIAAYVGIFLWVCGLGTVLRLPVRNRRIKQKVARAANAARTSSARAVV